MGCRMPTTAAAAAWDFTICQVQSALQSFWYPHAIYGIELFLIVAYFPAFPYLHSDFSRVELRVQFNSIRFDSVLHVGSLPCASCLTARSPSPSQLLLVHFMSFFDLCVISIGRPSSGPVSWSPEWWWWDLCGGKSEIFHLSGSLVSCHFIWIHYDIRSISLPRCQALSTAFGWLFASSAAGEVGFWFGFGCESTLELHASMFL